MRYAFERFFWAVCDCISRVSLTSRVFIALCACTALGCDQLSVEVEAPLGIDETPSFVVEQPTSTVPLAVSSSRRVTEEMPLVSDSASPAQVALGPGLITVRVEDPKGNSVAFRPKHFDEVLHSDWKRFQLPSLPADPQKVLRMVSDQVEVQALRLSPEGSAERVEVSWTAVAESDHWNLELPDGEPYLLQVCGMHVGTSSFTLRGETERRPQGVTLRLGPAVEPGVLEIAIQDPPGQSAKLGYCISLNTPDGVRLNSWRRVARTNPWGGLFLGESLGPEEPCVVVFQVPAGRYTVHVVPDWISGCVETPQSKAWIPPGPAQAAVDLAPGIRQPLAIRMEGVAKLSLQLDPKEVEGTELVHLDGGKLEFDERRTWIGSPGRLQITLRDEASVERTLLVTTRAGDWLVAVHEDGEWSLRPKVEILAERSRQRLRSRDQ